MKKMQLYILPVEHRVIFPYETLRVRIPETYQNNGKPMIFWNSRPYGDDGKVTKLIVFCFFSK